MSYIVKAVILLVSGVYYPISVLPGWMQPAARISPATYVLNGLRDALQHNAPIWSHTIWASTWPLLISGVVSIPLGLDRKSTRLNSSHQIISYAVFCLK